LKRIVQIAKELNFSSTTIIENFTEMGFQNFNFNTKINVELENVISKILNGYFTVAEFLQNSTQEEIDLGFASINNDEILSKKIVFTKDFFNERKSVKVRFNENQVFSTLTDEEAFFICRGFDNSYLSKIGRRYFSKEAISDLHRFEAHYAVMEAIKKYGSDYIGFILDLPPLPFYVRNFKTAFAEMDRLADKMTDPVLRLSLKDENGLQENYTIKFYERTSTDKLYQKNVLQIRNEITNSLIFSVSRGGKVLPEKGAKYIIPVIRLFISFSKDPKKYIIHFGAETGHCIYCNQPLTDPRSIERRMGLYCFNNYHA
jgi:hypothetical protein